MRVAILSASAPRHNAIGNQIAEKARFFLERGAETRVFVQDLRDIHADLRACTVQVDQPHAAGPAWDYLRSADLVFATYARYYDLLQWLPALAGMGPRIVFDYHGVTPPEFWRDQHLDILEQSIRNRGYVWCADHALTTSQFTALELYEATKFAREHTTTLPLVVDTERYRPLPDERFLHQKLGITGRILLYVGRVAGNKRVSLIVEALARLNDPELHVVVIGDCGDVYAEEMKRCQALSQQLGVADRVHWLGQLDDAELPSAYRSADVFVMPSLHEGFCVPILEAMACGVPVVASRSAALPETVGDAGLTFRPDDADDLARQLRRVLASRSVPSAPPPVSHAKRVAIVSFRFGPDIVGGAETSLRTMGKALLDCGHHVEVFTTCAATESRWRNDLPAGEVTLDGLPVHRFPIDSHDATAHGEAFRAIVDADGRVSPETEARYLQLSIHSSELVAALTARQAEFDAIITGPYLFGLTADIAHAFPDKALIVPCFHDEALARLAVWPTLYGNVGGLLYHSAEEQALAQAVLGINHPNARDVGTFLEAQPNPRLFQSNRHYIVYCGRYSEQKNLVLLLEWAREYQAEHPEELDVVFMGQGEYPLPAAPWLRDLGRVDEETKQAVLAGATALVQLSTQESLSLVVLEAWSAGTPVIVHRECPVLAGQIERARGGVAVANYSEFANALHELSAQSVRDSLGQRGKRYVEQQYASQDCYVAQLLSAIDSLTQPLSEQMHAQGIRRAGLYSRAAWQHRFADFVESLLLQPPRPALDELLIEPLRESLQGVGGARTMLVPIRLTQVGARAAVPDGPGRTVIVCEVYDQAGALMFQPTELPIPCLLAPGAGQVTALPIAAPVEDGVYRIVLRTRNAHGPTSVAVELPMLVDHDSDMRPATGATVFLDTVQKTLPLAHDAQQLPAGYIDVTEGTLAPVKRLIKGKLLHNFKHAYVDVLSRQQTQMNGHVVLMIQQLADCCQMLDHAVAGLHQRLDRLEGKMEEIAHHECATPCEAKPI